MTLQGRAALVTGAATGIGRAIAQRFAREGALVAVNFRSSREAADQLATQIRAAGGATFPVAADISVEPEVGAMLEQVRREFGRLDVLVNNAGWSTRIPHRKLGILRETREGAARYDEHYCKILHSSALLSFCHS